MTGKPQQTEEERQRAIREATQLVCEGEELFSGGKMVEAAQRFLRAVELDPKCVRAWNDMGVALHGVGEGKEAMTAFRTALNLDPKNEDAERNMAALQAELAGTEDPAPAVQGGPWPLATEAEIRILAWPDFASPDELDSLLREFGEVIARRDDACLCLRLDPRVDGSVVEVSRALREAHERVLGDEGDLEILLVAETMNRADWTRLAAAVQAVVALPSAGAGARAEFVAAAGLPVLTSRADLEEML